MFYSYGKTGPMNSYIHNDKSQIIALQMDRTKA